MKKLGSAGLSCAVFICMALFLQAQNFPTIIAPTEKVEPNTIYKADVKVANFQNIIGAQFTMVWDSTILKFRDAKNFLFEGTALTEAFGETKVSSGILVFIWVDAQLREQNLADSTTIFSIEFDVIGALNSTTPIRFTDDVASREVASGRERVEAAFHDGAITVMGSATSVSIYNSAPHKIQVKNSFPNPFHDFTKIHIEVKEATNARLVISNVQGQTVFEAPRTLQSGTNILTLTKDMFPASGTYQYSLIGTDFTVTQKLIFQ
ncbi:MAG: T9SS type A sorting domain-containing protein [Saprospiraceae bacterium]|nr:T9SS type A sorting domain-containing protein [Saprospiraceae bacterium]